MATAWHFLCREDARVAGLIRDARLCFEFDLDNFALARLQTHFDVLHDLVLNTNMQSGEHMKTGWTQQSKGNIEHNNIEEHKEVVVLPQTAR